MSSYAQQSGIASARATRRFVPPAPRTLVAEPRAPGDIVPRRASPMPLRVAEEIEDMMEIKTDGFLDERAGTDEGGVTVVRSYPAAKLGSGRAHYYAASRSGLPASRIQELGYSTQAPPHQVRPDPTPYLPSHPAPNPPFKLTVPLDYVKQTGHAPPKRLPHNPHSEPRCAPAYDTSDSGHYTVRDQSPLIGPSSLTPPELDHLQESDERPNNQGGLTKLEKKSMSLSSSTKHDGSAKSAGGPKSTTSIAGVSTKRTPGRLGTRRSLAEVNPSASLPGRSAAPEPTNRSVAHASKAKPQGFGVVPTHQPARSQQGFFQPRAFDSTGTLSHTRSSKLVDGRQLQGPLSEQSRTSSVAPAARPRIHNGVSDGDVIPATRQSNTVSRASAPISIAEPKRDTVGMDIDMLDRVIRQGREQRCRENLRLEGPSVPDVGSAKDSEPVTTSSAILPPNTQPRPSTTSASKVQAIERHVEVEKVTPNDSEEEVERAAPGEADGQSPMSPSVNAIVQTLQVGTVENSRRALVMIEGVETQAPQRKEEVTGERGEVIEADEEKVDGMEADEAETSDREAAEEDADEADAVSNDMSYQEYTDEENDEGYGMPARPVNQAGILSIQQSSVTSGVVSDQQKQDAVLMTMDEQTRLLQQYAGEAGTRQGFGGRTPMRIIGKQMMPDGRRVRYLLQECGLPFDMARCFVDDGSPDKQMTFVSDGQLAGVLGSDASVSHVRSRLSLIYNARLENQRLYLSGPSGWPDLINEAYIFLEPRTWKVPTDVIAKARAGIRQTLDPRMLDRLVRYHAFITECEDSAMPDAAEDVPDTDEPVQTAEESSPRTNKDEDGKDPTEEDEDEQVPTDEEEDEQVPTDEDEDEQVPTEEDEVGQVPTEEDEDDQDSAEEDEVDENWAEEKDINQDLTDEAQGQLAEPWGGDDDQSVDQAQAEDFDLMGEDPLGGEPLSPHDPDAIHESPRQHTPVSTPPHGAVKRALGEGDEEEEEEEQEDEQEVPQEEEQEVPNDEADDRSSSVAVRRARGSTRLATQRASDIADLEFDLSSRLRIPAERMTMRWVEKNMSELAAKDKNDEEQSIACQLKRLLVLKKNQTLKIPKGRAVNEPSAKRIKAGRANRQRARTRAQGNLDTR